MKGSSAVISFHFQKECALRDRRRLKSFIERIFKSYSTKVESLSIVFCSDDYLLDINREYLDHDYYTDIITFDLSEPGADVIGEIYISIDRVRDNAQTEGASVTNELHRVIFHGVLHLCGLGDKNAKQKQEMRMTEDKWLGKYFE